MFKILKRYNSNGKRAWKLRIIYSVFEENNFISITFEKLFILNKKIPLYPATDDQIYVQISFAWWPQTKGYDEFYFYKKCSY